MNKINNKNSLNPNTIEEIIISKQYMEAIKKLSPRQNEVLEGIAAGHTSKEIGVDLKISHRTVEKYCEQIRQVLDLHGSRSLFNWCEEHVS